MMSKHGFYVQLHLHTEESSKCGHASGAEIARACKAAGYDLIAITDHFLNANTTATADMSWAEKVEIQMRGYRAAKAEGERIGLEVIPGWETASAGVIRPQLPGDPKGYELLTYGLDEAFLLTNPDIADLPYYEYIRRIEAAGGLIVHAHPYRRAAYIPEDFVPDPTSVAAYEVYNDHNALPEYNRLALEEARRFGLLMLAGSDAHRAEHVGGGAMRFSRPVHSMREIFDALKAGDGEILEKLPEPFFL